MRKEGRPNGRELSSEVEDGNEDEAGEHERVEGSESVDDEASSVRVDKDDGEGESRVSGDPGIDENGVRRVIVYQHAETKEECEKKAFVRTKEEKTNEKGGVKWL